jgi:hypothetical protein
MLLNLFFISSHVYHYLLILRMSGISILLEDYRFLTVITNQCLYRFPDWVRHVGKGQ